MPKTPFKITREKHLDHMVRVVPFIVGGYAIQSYIILKIHSAGFASDSLIFLGAALCLMIVGFIAYDLKHCVEFHEDHLSVSLNGFGGPLHVAYHEISQVDISEAGQAFATLTVHCRGKKYSFYFVDDADKIQQWLKDKRFPQKQAA